MNTRFYNAKILTLADHHKFKITEGELWVKGNTICYIGDGTDTADVCKEGEVLVWDREIDACGNLLMPGFKNAHTHTAMTFLRSYADDLPLQDWLTKQVFPKEALLTADDIYWLSILGIMEYLTSGITSNFDMYFFPETIAKASIDCGFRTMQVSSFNDFTSSIEEMEEIYHPLLHGAVTNSMELQHNCIITGSNASGKSTFIKTIAVNVILAQSIHTCTAKRMHLPHAKMITSMAVRDDILSGDSYFIKEIKYLKRILDALSEDELVICVIDEILRGTNTQERIAASKAIMEYLAHHNCIAIVASHDKELTELEKTGYDNYHFSEEFGEEDIVFDYKLQKGPANSQNAIRLLSFTGFPETIIERAENIRSEYR